MELDNAPQSQYTKTKHSKAGPSLLHSFIKAYTHSPVNFSSVTGWRYPHIPRLRGNPALGRIPHLLRSEGILDNLIAAGKLAQQHSSGMCYYWLGHKLILLVTQPEHIHELLIENDKNISRGSSFTLFRKFMGSNITVDQDDAWKAKQTVYSDWIAKASTLEQHESKMMGVVKKYISYLESKKNDTIDLQNMINSYVLEILLSTVLLPKGYSEECVENMLDYHRYVTREIFEYKNIIKWLLPSFLRHIIYREPGQKVEEVCTQMRNRLNEIFLSPNETILKSNANFIHSIYDLTNHGAQDTLISDPNVFGDTSMILLAGQDTLLAAFQFAIKLLSANPHVESKLHLELKKNLHEKEFTLENINQVEYLNMILKETLRLFPSVTFLPRDVTTSFILGTVPVKKGDIIIFSPYLTHHLESIYQEPYMFIPERFSKDIKLPRQAYLPFGAGSHMCIGQRFAWQELKLLLAAIYLKFTIKIENNDFKISLVQGALKPKVKPMAQFISRDT